MAPGELISIFGRGFLPGLELGVDFDGKPAPVLYADSGQINAVVPFAVQGKVTTLFSLRNGGQTVGPYKIVVAAASPGTFKGVLNQDGSVNTVTNPAVPGNAIILYGTGEGRTSPIGQDGRLVGVPLPSPVAAERSASEAPS